MVVIQITILRARSQNLNKSGPIIKKIPNCADPHSLCPRIDPSDCEGNDKNFSPYSIIKSCNKKRVNGKRLPFPFFVLCA